MEKFNSATEVILQSILSDPTRKHDLMGIVKFVETPEARVSAIRNYCDKSLSTCLSVERSVVDNLISRTSWADVACHLENIFMQTDKNASH